MGDQKVKEIERSFQGEMVFRNNVDEVASVKFLKQHESGRL